MNVLMDTCSIINLANAPALSVVANLSACSLFVSPEVLTECEPRLAGEVMNLHADGRFGFANVDEVAADRYLELLEGYGLGSGETECLALAEQSDFWVCCDDRRARRIIETSIGAERVLGSLRLLRWSVDEARMTCGAAFDFLQKMKSDGGFLPNLQHEYFCAS
jgi:predicted nucleic acid-binding protein